MILSFTFAAGAHAAPASYVRICSLAGTDFYYIPGTNVCVNAMTGETQDRTDPSHIIYGRRPREPEPEVVRRREYGIEPLLYIRLLTT
jgi:hypothetical protein